jgi:glycosyltransferase involved in cell wall biosynthesis/SAM-dependent methyltransferase
MKEENWKDLYDHHCHLRGYQFTNSWFIYNIPIWQQTLQHIKDLPNLNFLEIGSWEGQSTCWLLDNVLTHPTSKITCIDTFAGGIEHRDLEELSLIELRFDSNIKKANSADKVKKIVGYSQYCLRELPLNNYDFIYIDGSHIASDVLEDIILSWRLLKEEGIIIFDDYQWQAYQDQPLKHPAPAIDSFLSIFQDKINVLYKDYQVIIQKKYLQLDNYTNNEQDKIKLIDREVPSNDKNFDDLPSYYKHLRPEIFNFVPLDALNILDIGCGAGVLGKALKTNNNKRFVVGIELNQEAIYFAKQNLDQIYQFDIEKFALPFPSGFFDCIIFADVLEHLVDPWQTLQKYLKLLKHQGTIIISIPNIRNIKILHQLIELKSWKYEDEGILDKTHLRFFTKNDFLEILDQVNIKIQSLFYLREQRFNQFYNPETHILSIGKLSITNTSQSDFEEITANQIVFQGIYNKKEFNENNHDFVTNLSLSVIVPWWDHTEFLELWENNLKYLSDCEIIFIDNGSQEESKKTLAKFCQIHNIKLIRNEENRGFAVANNQGLAVAMGDYILHLNNDISIKGELNIKHLCNLAQDGIAGPIRYVINELNINYVEGWALCAKKSLLDNLGGWNEIYGPGYWDDIDLCYRAQLAGYQIIAIPELHEWIEHITNATGLDGRIDHDALHITNRKKFLDQYFTIHPKILIDGVFFQMHQTGIARVWRSLLEVWVNNGFAKHIVFLDRGGNTAPQVDGIRYRNIRPYKYNNTDEDRAILQQICDEEEADVFISTYYTTPITTPSVFMAYDMIPEILGVNLNDPMWQEKHYAISHASSYIAISVNTAQDLVKLFSNISLEQITIAYCGIDAKFQPATSLEIEQFKNKYGIKKPYFLFTGATWQHKNAPLFFQAFYQLPTKEAFEIVYTGSPVLNPELRHYTAGIPVHSLYLSDEELRLAYAGAIALVFPSKYEGFGMPIAEAMACGCPVITCHNSSIPEVAGEAAIYVSDYLVQELSDALCQVQKHSVRTSLINNGLEQVKQFSWQKMADKVSQTLIEATFVKLNLREINLIIFPDWSQDEDSLLVQLAELIEAITTCQSRDKITLLIDNSNVNEETIDLILSSIFMNLLMEKELNVPEQINVSLLGDFSDAQWRILIPRLRARVILEGDDHQKISQILVDQIPSIKIDEVFSYN